MSAVMMLNYLGDERDDPACKKAADRVKNAYNRALEEGQTTRDLGGSLGTMEFADAVAARLG
jgi:3-isopropylmalate dehydrogenase